MKIAELKKPVKEQLDEFDKYFKNILSTKVSLLNIILSYITQKKGKQIRPLLVMYSAELCGGINQRTYVGAALVELLHTATLIHDDVVDEADERRGLASINAKWNNKIAVLIGDYLLAKGLLTAVDAKEFDFLTATSSAVRRMSEGELLAIDKSRNIMVDEESYFKIISDKTASLISTCCHIGAISATDSTEVQEKLKLFGEYIGIAFQIRDDIFDYTAKSNLLGKPVGNDLKEKKITLPLIHVLSKMNLSDSYNLVKKIKKGMKKADIKNTIEFVIKEGGIDYADKIAQDYIDKALAIIDEFPDSEVKTNIKELTNFIINRSH